MKFYLFAGLTAFFLFAAGNGEAQILNPKKVLQKKIVDKTNETINKKSDEVVDSSFKKTGRVADSLLKIKRKGKVADSSFDKKNVPETVTVSKTDTVANAVPNNNPSFETYSKFDFIPGEKIVFFDDFSEDNIGDFPALWNTNGSAEIATTNLYPGRWMKFNGRISVWTDALLTLPDNYTIEFDIIPVKGESGRMVGYAFRLMQSINAKSWDGGTVPGKAGFSYKCEYFGRSGYSTYINGQEGSGLGLNGFKEDKSTYQVENKKYHIAVWVQKSRVRLYLNENKLVDLPKAFPLASVKMDRIRFEEGAAMISNVRIAVGAPDMRSKLMTEGKLVSYGIYFDVNKDVVKPESYSTLKNIAGVLQENPDIKIKIIGHTDADGNDSDNLDLSKRRAASVKNELVNTFGIEASRIETDGKGETQTMAPNDTPSNKALNRRVEFIKL